MLAFWKRLDGGVIGALIGMSMGVIALLAIGITNLVSSNQSTTTMTSIPLLGAVELREYRSGSIVAVEGRIDGIPRAQGLIAYQYQQGKLDSDDNGDSLRWQPVEDVRPWLRIELHDGSVPITGTYTLSGATITRYQGEQQRYIGLERQQPVFAWGRLQQDDAEPVLVADTVYAGTRADYMRELQTLHTLGWSFIGLSLALAALCTWISKRFLLPISTGKQPSRRPQSTRKPR